MTKLADIKHEVIEVDAKGLVLGRLATKVANLLVGKNKTYFVRYLDCGDFVTVKNAGEAKVTGNKLEKKVYTRYSGYPAGLSKVTMKNVAPEERLHKAVLGMLPNNKLRAVWIKRLKFV